MTAKPENLGHFIFNSDYPTDKIVWLYEGQLTTDSNGEGSELIYGDDFPYGDPPIFVKGVGSVDNWQSSFMLGSEYPFAGSLYDSTTINCGHHWISEKQEYISSLYVRVLLRNYPNKTVKLRLWGMQREDIAVAKDYGNTSNISKNKLKFDSNNNYPRLYMEGVALSGETIQHDLNKIPYVEYWCQTKSTLVPQTKDNAFDWGWDYYAGATFESGGATVQATNKTLTFTKKGSDDVFYYYRVYA